MTDHIGDPIAAAIDEIVARSRAQREQRRQERAALAERLRALAQKSHSRETISSSELAELMDWQLATARSALGRLGVAKKGRDPLTAENLYPRRAALLALAGRPGQGRGQRPR